MNRTIRKAILYTLSMIVIAGIVLAIAGAIKYYQLTKGQVIADIPEKATLTAASVPLGESMTYEAKVTCGWNTVPDAATVNNCKGAQPIGKPEIKFDSIGWGTWTWLITGELQTFTTGKIAASELQVSLETNGQRYPQKYNIAVPSFEAKAIEIKDPKELEKLDLASSIKIAKKTSYKMWILLSGISMFILILIITIIWLISHKTKTQVIIPPWTIALNQLHELSNSLKNGMISGEVCIARLTDIVRYYLEKQFHLHAQTQTTKEFFNEVEKPNSPLADQHRSFLKEFLTAADLVKFANCPADTSLLQNAIDKADLLIEETRPHEEEEEKKKAGAK